MADRRANSTDACFQICLSLVLRAPSLTENIFNIFFKIAFYIIALQCVSICHVWITMVASCHVHQRGVQPNPTNIYILYTYFLLYRGRKFGCIEKSRYRCCHL